MGKQILGTDPNRRLPDPAQESHMSKHELRYKLGLGFFSIIGYLSPSSKTEPGCLPLFSHCHRHHHLNQVTPDQHGATRVPPGNQRVAGMVQLPGSRLPDCTHTCGSCSRRENHALFK
ncbi:hypothetical protein HanRHA438_Chr02g0052331 [Helianthus annuus]|nr:hypothetical protein HanIR_Chr02g0057151 [Helianthus annuus]KAJ0938668.1 hypothetical protein HanRHA438_Chr02g0052331 [Helianthus annuus]